MTRNTQYNFIDLINITYIGTHDTSKSKNGKFKLLKIFDTNKILKTHPLTHQTHPLTHHDSLKIMKTLFPIYKTS